MEESGWFPIRWIKVAYTHPFGAADLIGSIVASAGATLFLLEKVGLIKADAAGELGGWSAVIGVVAVAVTRILMAPSWLIAKRDEAIEVLERKVAEYEEGPRFQIEPGEVRIGKARPGGSGVPSHTA